MSEKPQKPQLHISAINMASHCGEQYRRRYIEKHIIPPGVALIMGTGLDRAVTANLENKIKEGELLQAEAVADAARDAVTNEVKGNGLRLTAEDIEEYGDIKSATGKMVDRTVRMSLSHHVNLAPLINPRYVQRGFVIELKNYPVDLAGQIDIDEPDNIRDTKSSRKSPNANAAEESDQLTQYALARKVIDGEFPKNVMLDYVVDYETDKKKEVKTKVVTLTSTRSMEDVRPLLARVEAVVRATEAGVFIPVKQSDPLCSERFCGFFTTCAYVRRPVSVAVPNAK